MIAPLIAAAVATSPIEAPVYIEDLSYYGDHGNSDGVNVYFDTYLHKMPKRMINIIVHHELCHVLHTRNDRFLRHFGRGPYSTIYAKTNKYEDFAETCVDITLYNKGTSRKHNIIRHLLKNGSSK